MDKKLISIVLPAYREEKNIPLVYKEIKNVVDDISNYDFEIIFVNDWSPDGTWEAIKKLAKQDKIVKWIDLSRNFWHQWALTAWYNHAKWDAIISMDCDLQDPIDIAIKMVFEWEKWYEIVYARRKNRNDWFIKKYTAILYYKILSYISDTNIPRNVGDFRLIDKKVLKEFLKLWEKDRYIRWIFAWLWYKYTFVDFDRPERIHWKTWYTWWKMIKLAMDWVLNFSMLPLRLWFVIGMIMIIVSIIFFIYIFIDFFIRGVDYPLYKWLSVVWFWVMWLQFIFMWIIWEYVWRIYNETRDRPVFIAREKINLKE